MVGEHRHRRDLVGAYRRQPFAISNESVQTDYPEKAMGIYRTLGLFFESRLCINHFFEEGGWRGRERTRLLSAPFRARASTCRPVHKVL